MAYGKRKKGGQRLMEMSRAGAKRKAAQRERTAKNFGVGAKNTVQPKKKAAPAKAAPKKKVAAPKGSGKLMEMSPRKKTSRKSSGPAPLPKNIQGMARPTLSDLPGNILKGSAIAFPGSIAVRGIGKKAIESGLKTEAGKKLMKSLTNVFKRKPKPTPMPKVSADKAKAGVKRQQQRVGTGKEVTTPKPRNKKAADQKNLERQQRAGVKGARSKAAEKVLKDAEKKKPAKTVSKEVLSKASSKSSGPKYRSTATPSKKKAAKKKTAKK